MTRKATDEDYKLLGLQPDATADEARRAYHRMKALYAEGSLATYSLLGDEERSGLMDSIERAYMRISQDLRPRVLRPSTDARAESGGSPEPPEPGERLGPYLRRRREALGYTLRDVATRTRIRSTYLESIENERFGDLPAPVYLRGFVLEYARLLGLPEPEKLTARYLQLASPGDD